MVSPIRVAMPGKNRWVGQRLVMRGIQAKRQRRSKNGVTILFFCHVTVYSLDGLRTQTVDFLFRRYTC